MFYFDPILIESIAQTRLTGKGGLINLDMNDYRTFASDCDFICAVRVKSVKGFDDLLSELKYEIYNTQSAVDELIEVMIHLILHQETDMTMKNYALLGQTMKEVFGDQTRIKVGFATDDTLPVNYKDIMVFIAGK
jgi:hypothetical protein